MIQNLFTLPGIVEPLLCSGCCCTSAHETAVRRGQGHTAPNSSCISPTFKNIGLTQSLRVHVQIKLKGHTYFHLFLYVIWKYLYFYIFLFSLGKIIFVWSKGVGE